MPVLHQLLVMSRRKVVLADRYAFCRELRLVTFVGHIFFTLVRVEKFHEPPCEPRL